MTDVSYVSLCSQLAVVVGPTPRRVVVNRRLQFLPLPVSGRHGTGGHGCQIPHPPQRPPGGATASEQGPLTAAALLVIVLLPDETDARGGTGTHDGKRRRGTARAG